MWQGASTIVSDSIRWRLSGIQVLLESILWASVYRFVSFCVVGMICLNLWYFSQKQSSDEELSKRYESELERLKHEQLEQIESVRVAIKVRFCDKLAFLPGSFLLSFSFLCQLLWSYDNHPLAYAWKYNGTGNLLTKVDGSK